MSDYPTPNAYYIRIVAHENYEEESPKPTLVIGPISYLRKAEKCERGVNRNLNHDQYYCEYVWIGPAPEIGNAMPLSQIPLGTIISCSELHPGQGAGRARSAGAFAQLMARDGKFATVKLPSGETRLILVRCLATIGVVSNSDHQLLVSGKAGRSRWLGRRPRTRPVVMNPVDHPMGGGEGKSSGGHPRSRKGIPAKGYRTRSRSKASNKYILERRKK